MMTITEEILKEVTEQALNFVNNPTTKNAQALVEWCQKEGGKVTGAYPTNYVMHEDIESAVNDDNYSELNHETMKNIAEAIGESDTEYGTFWEVIRSYYYEVVEPNK